MLEDVSQPWPWYVAGPLIGLMVPALTLLDRRFGVSTSLRHICAATLAGNRDFFRYDWRHEGGWNLALVAGVAVGGIVVGTLLPGASHIGISDATVASLREVGITEFDGIAPTQLISWHAMGSAAGLIAMLGGGFLVGFGARVAGGCTSGHAISGLAELRASSLVTVVGFFVGGLTTTFVVLPWLIRS